MWTRIVGALLVLIVATFAIQWVLPRNARGRGISARQYLLYDITPIIAFFGVLLILLSLVEAARLGFIYAWSWGGGLGLLASIGFWLARPYAWQPPAAGKREPVWRLAWRLVRTFGPILLVVLIVLNLLTRWLGPIVEVFAAGAFGIFVVVIALLFLVELLRRSAPVSMNEQRKTHGK